MSAKRREPAGASGPAVDSEKLLATVWAVLAGGVVVFAVVALAVIGPFDRAADARPWRWGWLALAVATVGAIGWLRGRLVPATPPEKRRKTAILVWALAEGQAMVGLVAYLLTRDLIPAVVGLALFVYLFLRHRPSTFLQR